MTTVKIIMRVYDSDCSLPEKGRINYCNGNFFIENVQLESQMLTKNKQTKYYKSLNRFASKKNATRRTKVKY